MKKIIVIVLSLVIMLTLALPTAVSAEPGYATWFNEDTATKGDWYPTAPGSPIGVYGSYAYILPDPVTQDPQIPIGNYSSPIGFDPGDPLTWPLLGLPPYDWTYWQLQGLNHAELDPPYGDEFWSKDPEFAGDEDYEARGTEYEYGTGMFLQYPVFEFGWEPWHGSQTGAREVYYPIASEWRYACWDDGGERCKPEHGYMDFNLTLPEGYYMLSLYAYDYEGNSRASQTYQIWDATLTTMWAEKQISGSVFDDGVFESFIIEAPYDDFTFVVRVFNDAGHPDPTNNVALSGIFLDQLEPICGHTIGFWKENASKLLGVQKGKGNKGNGTQVTIPEYESALDCVVSSYSVAISDWDADGWNISSPADGEDMEWALHWLSYGAYNPDTDKFGKPSANDPQVKARAQLLALLLTACYQGGDYTGAWIVAPECSDDDGDRVQVSDLITEAISAYNGEDYSAAYCLANYLNENCAMMWVDP